MKHVDFDGHKLKIGDRVAYVKAQGSGAQAMAMGTIVGFNSKSFKVKQNECLSEVSPFVNVAPHRIAFYRRPPKENE